MTINGALPADRQLDERIAREVFGGPSKTVEWWWWSTADWPIGPLYKHDAIPDDAKAVLYAGPHFSTDITAAWLVVDWFNRRFSTRRLLADALQAEMAQDGATVAPSWWIFFLTPERICRAALAAVENYDSEPRSALAYEYPP